MPSPATSASGRSGSRDDLEAVEEHYRQHLETERENGNRAGEAECLDNLGAVAHSKGDAEAAAEYHRESLAIKRDLDDRAGEANSLGNLGLAARNRGDLDAAEEYFERALEIQRDLGDRAGAARSLANLGLVYVSRDALPEAKTYLEQGARGLGELGDAREAGKLIRTLVDVCEELGHPDEAVEWCETGMRIAGQSGNRSLQRELSVLYAQLSGRNVADATTELYYHALGHLLQGRGGEAALFEQVWQHRTELDEATDVYPTAVSAGVFLAGLLAGADAPGGIDADPDDVLGEIGPERLRLPEAVRALYERLDEGETDLTPGELRERAEASDPDESESDEFTVEAMERRSVALLLDRLPPESGR